MKVERFLVHDLAHALETRPVETNAGRDAIAERVLTRFGNERSFDHILDEICSARREMVAGQIDLGQAVEVEVDRLAPGRVEHAADPGPNSFSWQKRAIAIASANPETRGGLMLMISRSSALLCSQSWPRPGVAQGVDALVEADRCAQLARNLAVEHDVVVVERLLDEEQIEVVQRLQRRQFAMV